MTHHPRRGPTWRRSCAPLPLLVALCGGCASVPEVESRLQTLQFHPNMYVVQAGDTLETVAFRYELAPGELAALNPGLEPGRLEPGLRINVRPGTELPPAVRARSGTALAAARPARETTPASVERPELAAVVTRPVPRPVVAAPLPTVTETYRPPGRSAEAPSAGVFSDGVVPPVAARTADADYPHEEIVADDFFAEAGEAETLDAGLRRYVGRWSWPTDGAVARGYAPERVGGQGVDIAGVPGQPVRAALDGTVVYSGRDLSGDGNLVIVRHDGELMTTYSHADELYVAEDDRVLAGDPIASLGWNERRESVLRFEVRRDGDPLDPMAFLPPR